MSKPCVKCGATERYASGRCAPCSRAAMRESNMTQQQIARKRERKLAHASKPASRLHIAIYRTIYNATRQTENLEAQRAELYAS